MPCEVSVEAGDRRCPFRFNRSDILLFKHEQFGVIGGHGQLGFVFEPVGDLVVEFVGKGRVGGRVADDVSSENVLIRCENLVFVWEIGKDLAIDESTIGWGPETVAP